MCSFLKTQLAKVQLLTSSTFIEYIFDGSLLASFTLYIMKYIIIFLLLLLHFLFLLLPLQRRIDLYFLRLGYWLWFFLSFLYFFRLLFLLVRLLLNWQLYHTFFKNLYFRFDLSDVDLRFFIKTFHIDS